MKGPQSLKASTCILFVILCFFFAPHVTFGEEINITIDVAPNVINIGSESEVVTVHTNIAYNLVAGSNVTLNDVPINYYKSDNRGYFVAKFLSDEVKNLKCSDENSAPNCLVLGDYNTLTLVGYTTNNDMFLGSQDIMVIDVVPAGSRK